MKQLIIIGVLTLLCSPLLLSQRYKTSQEDELVDGINYRMDTYAFQYNCLDKALKVRDPNQVKEIYFRGCTEYYTSFPREVLRFKNLEVLIFHEGEFRWIPPEIKQLKKLKVLSIWSRLVGLPSELGELTELRYLDLANNRIKKIPPSFQNLRKLRYLDLGNNPMTEFPSFMVDLPNLSTFFWLGNRCDIVPERIRQLPKFSFYLYCRP